QIRPPVGLDTYFSAIESARPADPVCARNNSHGCVNSIYNSSSRHRLPVRGYPTMTLDRRALLAAGTALLSGNGLVAAASDAAIKPTQNIGKRHRRIATEEAYAVPELVDGVRSGLQSGAKDADTKFWAVLLGENPWGKMVLRRLLDLEQERLAIMDQHGVDMHVLSITVPGPQMFDSATGTRLATVINDR